MSRTAGSCIGSFSLPMLRHRLGERHPALPSKLDQPRLASGRSPDLRFCESEQPSRKNLSGRSPAPCPVLSDYSYGVVADSHRDSRTPDNRSYSPRATARARRTLKADRVHFCQAFFCRTCSHVSWEITVDTVQASRTHEEALRAPAACSTRVKLRNMCHVRRHTPALPASTS